MIDLFIALYLGGNVFWLTFAIFDTTGWDNAFFIWQAIAGSSLLTWLCLFTCSSIATKKKVFPLILFTFFKLIWELISVFTGIGVNNEIAVMVLFLLAIAITGYLAFRPQGFLPRMFEKHLNL